MIRPLTYLIFGPSRTNSAAPTIVYPSQRVPLASTPSCSRTAKSRIG